MAKETLVDTFKYKKELYKVVRKDSISILSGTNKEFTYYTIETPENCFGYPNIIILNWASPFDLNDKSYALALNRNESKALLDKCTRVLMKWEGATR